MILKPLLLLSGLATLGAVADAEPTAPEFAKCSSFGADVHEFIECLSTMRDEWDRKASNVLADGLEKVDDTQRRRLSTQVKKQREQRVARCGVPSPVSVHAAECQRATAVEQLGELERAIATMTTSTR